MPDFNEIVERYLAVWNEPDAGSRSKAIADLWTEDASYTDPLAAVSGHEGIAAVIAGAREMFPACEFRLLGPVDGHHNIVRFRWELVPEGSDESIAIGFDVAVIAPDGKINAVGGFLDKVPAMA